MLFPLPTLNLNEKTCINTIQMLLKALNVNAEKKDIHKIKEYPDYPSLLCISDFLTDRNIDNIAIQANFMSISELPTPFIAQIQTDNWESFFVVVKEYNSEKVIISHNYNQRWKKLSAEDFLRQFTGVTLLVDTSNE